MNLAQGATILRFREGNSDKVWVIVPNVTVGGEHLVSWGRTRWGGKASASLQTKRVSGSENSRILKKLNSGYSVWSGVKFDLDDHRVIQVDAEPVSKPITTPCFWYRIDVALFPDEVALVLHQISNGLHAFEYQHGYPGLVAEFQSLPLVRGLRLGKAMGQVEYSESPMSVLVLFALCRAHILLVKVSDHNNNLLPNRLTGLRALMSNEGLFGSLPEYWQPPLFQAFAAAMQCIDPVFNLAHIQSNTPAAFF
jgi:hypothetical protein